MVESKPSSFKPSGDLSIVANELEGVIYSSLDHLTLLCKTAMKNKPLAELFISKYLVSFANFILAINKTDLANFKNPAQAYEVVHYITTLREIG